jgi:hypothetical protein
MDENFHLVIFVKFSFSILDLISITFLGLCIIMQRVSPEREKKKKKNNSAFASMNWFVEYFTSQRSFQCACVACFPKEETYRVTNTDEPLKR